MYLEKKKWAVSYTWALTGRTLVHPDETASNAPKPATFRPAGSELQSFNALFCRGRIINRKKYHALQDLNLFTSETSCLAPTVFCKCSYQFSDQSHFSHHCYLPQMNYNRAGHVWKIVKQGNGWVSGPTEQMRSFRMLKHSKKPTSLPSDGDFTCFATYHTVDNVLCISYVLDPFPLMMLILNVKTALLLLVPLR